MDKKNFTAVSEAPAVYVGTYQKYNNGSLAGEWVYLEDFDSFDEFMEYLHEIHSDEEDPEFMFQDFENFPSRWYSESCMDEDTFNKIIEWANDDNKEAMEIYMDEFCTDDLSNFEDRFMGQWDSEEDFAWNIFEECYAYDMPEFARQYFDIESFARDLFLDGYTFANGFVFSDC